VFALIDSLVLQSGYSNLRLESYLFTLESFKDVKRVLKPSGVYAVYNFFRQGWIAARIREQLRLAFDGVDPVVIVTRHIRVPPIAGAKFDEKQWQEETTRRNPPATSVKLDDFDPGASTGFFAGGKSVVEPLRKAFEGLGKNEKGGTVPVKYWYPWYTGVRQDTKARFGIAPPAEPPHKSAIPARKIRWKLDAEGKETDEAEIDETTGQVRSDEVAPLWMGLVPAEIEDSKGHLRLATDDWPFLYMREAVIPIQTWVSVALTLLLSFGIWRVFGGNKALSAEAAVTPDYGSMLRAFFLGAGFMLVETKAVVQMALLFGGTWTVNTVVFAAILAMSLAGNLFAGKVNPKRLEPYYLGLFATIALGLILTPAEFLGLSPMLQIISVCLLVFAPIAFAGVIFATSFKRTTQPDRVIGANVAGALIGGLAENSSVILGFRLLLCVAGGFYLLSALFGNRPGLDGRVEKGV
jgi:hypothetical protein